MSPSMSSNRGTEHYPRTMETHHEIFGTHVDQYLHLLTPDRHPQAHCGSIPSVLLQHERRPLTSRCRVRMRRLHQNGRPLHLPGRISHAVCKSPPKRLPKSGQESSVPDAKSVALRGLHGHSVGLSWRGSYSCSGPWGLVELVWGRFSQMIIHSILHSIASASLPRVDSHVLLFSRE
jgi:hypothetical protein